MRSGLDFDAGSPYETAGLRQLPYPAAQGMLGSLSTEEAQVRAMQVASSSDRRQHATKIAECRFWQRALSWWASIGHSAVLGKLLEGSGGL